MTGITELAQREKFEAWWESEYKHLESSKYTDAVPHIKYGFWMAYQAGGAELVEALETAQQQMTESENRVRKQNRHICELFDDNTALRKRIAELESRTVTFKLPFTPEPSAFAPWVAKAFYQFHKDTVKSCVAVFSDACATAGIKVEAE
ncbi:RelE family toxin-antitoxin system [Klebsiella pneumoniae]|nr:RelE family toxin-antitoxin system [Klebsiella pneumoniae]SYH21099.1 RelE family toxin-antitoxin system [Klebsiella pneumoniae]VVJ49672.1 Uncharacterised protein [Klebsiella pneumoniae]VVJ50284.1 Uncharacterised protein [Klebsiella pneumoniae]